MDVRAVILVGGRNDDRAEKLAGVPMAFMDVLGEPVLQRVLERLEQFGVTAAAVVTEVPAEQSTMARGSVRPGLRWFNADGANFWRATETAFNEFAQAGADLVLLLRVGAYAEIDLEDAIEYHLKEHCRVTSILDSEGMPLDAYVISASRRNDAAFLMRHELRQMRVPCGEYRCAGYVNRLETAAHLRQLAIDSFLGQTTIRPIGTEVRPGIWVAEGASVHKGARLVAPCYIGPHAKVRAAAVLTRGAVVEHHAHVDCGTVVENSTVLPLATIGAGLDVIASLIGFHRVWNFHRGVEVEIADTKLVGTAWRSAPLRAITDAMQLATWLPKTVAEGFRFGGRRTQPTLQEAVRQPAPALKDSEARTDEGLAGTTEFASVRRYGNE